MYDVYIVRRTQIYISDEQGEDLARLARGADVTMSALIRRAIDSLLEEEATAAARLERFHAAVEGSAGSAPDLPPGAAYVEAIRPGYEERERSLWGGRG